MDRIDHDGLRHGGLADTETPVSLGYDRIRFTARVFLGDTITVTYTITELHPVPRHFRSKIEASNQQGATVAVAEHVPKWIRRADVSP